MVNKEENFGRFPAQEEAKGYKVPLVDLCKEDSGDSFTSAKGKCWGLSEVHHKEYKLVRMFMVTLWSVFWRKLTKNAQEMHRENLRDLKKIKVMFNDQLAAQQMMIGNKTAERLEECSDLYAHVPVNSLRRKWRLILRGFECLGQDLKIWKWKEYFC